MSDAQKKALAIITLSSDDDYFAIDGERASAMRLQLAAALRVSTFASKPAPGPRPAPEPVLALAAPKIVALDEHDDVPVVVAARTTGARIWEVARERNRRLCAVDLSTGEAHFALLEVSHKRGNPPPLSRVGSAPGRLDAAAISYPLDRYDVLRFALGHAWKPGRFALTIFNYDQISNTVVVELRAKKDAPAHVTAQPRLPSTFLGTAAEAPRPAGTGALLAIPDHGATGSPIVVRGGIALHRSMAAVAPALPLGKGGDVEVLAATIVLMTLDAEDPIEAKLSLLLRASGERSPDQPLAAAFQCDLARALGHPLAPGSYQAYLLSGAAVDGPHTIQVTAPNK